jgi:hypothetical protein
MKLKQINRKMIQKAADFANATIKERKYKKIATKYNLHGYKRIYLVHIRKTGGTSLNNMFLSLSGEDSNYLYKQLAITPDHRLISNELVYVGWNVGHINRGNYFYGFSHTPLHQLKLPKKTFTISCFRDPVRRVVSHYNMLMDFRVNNIDHPCMAVEGKWLGENFDDFLQRIPQEHLLNQLFMFSNRYNINEAILNVQQLSHYFFNETFSDGIIELNKKTGLDLESIHIRKANYNATISVDNLTKLKNMLDKEYKFLGRIRESQRV